MVGVGIRLSWYRSTQGQSFANHCQLQGAAAVVGEENIVKSGRRIPSRSPLVGEGVAGKFLSVSKAVLHLKHFSDDLVWILIVSHVEIPAEDDRVFPADLSQKLCCFIQLAHSVHVIYVCLNEGRGVVVVGQEGGAEGRHCM